VVSNSLKIGLIACLYAAFVQISQAQVFKSEADFIQNVHQRYGIKTETLEAWFKQAVFKKSIIKAMNRPSEAKPWYQYRKIFLTTARIQQGGRFMLQQQKSLAAAEKKYGVPAAIISAIIGVETSYGRNTGSFRVWDALYTLAFNFPRRAEFFQQELAEFILLCQEQNFEITYPKGSYAGAMGIGQFMPSSYRQYAVDGNADGQINLWQVDDAIASVAHYLQQYGWQAQEPIIHAIPAPASEAQAEALIALGLKPSLSISELQALGLNSPVIQDPVKAAVIGLKTEQGMAYWLGRNNFYTITRYNHSRRYAMVVKQLADAISHNLRRISAK